MFPLFRWSTPTVSIWMATAFAFSQVPAPAPQRPLHIITSSCSGKTPPGSPSVKLNELDASLGTTGVIHLLHDGKHWSKEQHQSTFMGDHLIPSASSNVPFLATPIKFRNGTFWRRDEKRVQSWDPQHGWSTVLNSTKAFHDFEVTYQGTIALVGTESHLLAVYEPQGEEPSHKVSYPDLGISAQRAAYLNFYWTRARTVAVDQVLLLYFAGCGRMFLFNVSDRTLKEVDTPWSPLDPKDTTKTIHDGAANLSGHPSLMCIQMIPISLNSVRIAYQCPKVDAVLRYAADGKVESFITKRLPSASDVLQSFDLDTQSGSKGSITPHLDLKFPVWAGGQDGVVPLASIFTGTGKPTSSALGQ